MKLGTLERIILFILFSCAAWAHAGAVITYHGRIVDPQNLPVESAAVTFTIRILSPATTGSCLLYEEIRTIPMTGSDGIFVIPIGDGTGIRTSADPGIQIEKVFSNDPTVTFSAGTYPKFVCNSGSTYTANILDNRQLFVSFKEAGGTVQYLPGMDINFVPFAISSYDSQKIGGAAANSVMRLSDATAMSLAPSLTTSQFNEIKSLADGSSTQYAQPGQLNGVNLPALGNGQVLGWSAGSWIGVTPLTSYSETDPSVKSFAKSDLPACGADEVLKPNAGGTGFDCVTVSAGGAGSVTSVAPGTGLKSDVASNGAIISTGTLSVDVGTGANQIVQMTAGSKLPSVDGSDLTNVVASSIRGNAVAATTLTAMDQHKIYKWDGTNFVPGFIGLADLRKLDGTQQAVACPPGQISTWEALTDNTSCVAISVGGGNFGNQAAHAIFAGPSSGGATTPTFRSLVEADIPALGAAKITSGVMDADRLPAASGTASGIVTQGVQDIAGVKTFLNGGIFSSNVGIGTDTPTAGLHVHGLSGIKVTDTFAGAGGTLNFNGSMLLLKNLANGALVLDSPMAINMTVDNNARMYIDTTGEVGIGTTTPLSALDVTSTTSGFLPPRMTTAQRTAIASPVNGMIVFDTSIQSLFSYQNNAWVRLNPQDVVSAKVYKTGDQTLVNSVWTKLTWNAEVWDTSDLHDNVTNNQRFTVPAGGAGKYIINISVNYATNSAGARWVMYYKNGAGVDYCNRLSDGAQGGASNISCLWVEDLADGDYIEVSGYQSSGGGLNVLAANSNFSMVRLNGLLGSGGGSDNMGNQIATRNFTVGSYVISNDGGTDGITIDSSARVGIGNAAPQAKLDVNGGIRLGLENTCDATNEGTQRYAASYKIMQYCDGTTWKDMGWRSLATSNTAAYDINCSYRVWSDGVQFVATMVGEGMLFFETSSAGFVLYALPSNDKTHLDVVSDGNTANIVTNNAAAVTKIEYRCN
ncbi:hypothetical protein D3C87_175060 [compost metagenome]